ncbi:MAG: hypothetical protein QMD36_04605 [Candidatus Aenigmarchaeota archaeon]|nr:hypothetical protein [Candidatus Aenigmarchaeota archaeon]
MVRKEEPSWIKKTCYQVPGLTKEQQDELYAIASTLIFLNPEKIRSSYKELTNLAVKFEKSKDFIKAKLNRRIAIGLAIYEGNKKGARTNIVSYAKLEGDEGFGKKALEYLEHLFWVQEHGHGYKPRAA